MEIRRAKIDDIDILIELLHEVEDIHYNIRKDLFKKNGIKYNKEMLKDIINDENKPIFVIVDDEVIGYAFCQINIIQNDLALNDMKYLYIDDLCINSSKRGKSYGILLINHIKEYAKETGCSSITLNVWEGNSARKFYDKLGFTIQKTTLELKNI